MTGPLPRARVHEHARPIVAQFPAKIGSLGIATLYRAVQKKKVAKFVETGTAMVTKANASQLGG